MKTRKFSVKGLNENGTVDAFKKSLRQHDGLNSIKVDLKLDTVTVDYDEGKYNQDEVSQIVRDIGLTIL
ncbi:MAG: heavy metal-associated domain-containing protein [Eubacteriales bacterium]|nr:heavy metal-associated domain-containing protein [Eubacteriales bacterium]